MTKEENNTLHIGLPLLYKLDFTQPYETQLAITILYLSTPNYLFWGETVLKTSPNLLIDAFDNYPEVNARQQKNICEALISLKEKGIIDFQYEKLNFKTKLNIDVTSLLQLTLEQTYVELLLQDFYTIMHVPNDKGVVGIQSSLLQTFLVIKARWNFKNLFKLRKVDDFAYEVFQEDGYEDIQQLKGIFSTDTYDFIRTHKHYELEEVKAWCGEDSVVKYVSKLKEIGCIKCKTKKIRTDGLWRNRNFYYSPDIEDKFIEPMIQQYLRRYNYAVKQDDSDK